MDFAEAYSDFIESNREARKYAIDDYSVTMIRNGRSVEVHKHRDGFKAALNRDFEDNRTLLMEMAQSGFHELFSFGDHSGERTFRGDEGTITISAKKITCPLDKKHAVLLGKILDHYELVEK